MIRFITFKSRIIYFCSRPILFFINWLLSSDIRPALLIKALPKQSAEQEALKIEQLTEEGWKELLE